MADNDNNKVVVQLAEWAGESIAVTEVSPYYGQFIGKQIAQSGKIIEYPDVKWWRQRVELVPATIPHVFVYLRAAMQRNVCLIRGTPANLERERTLKQIAYRSDRGKDRNDHGFVDEPTRLLAFDIDGAPIRWRKNPEKAIRTILGFLGEPWASTSFVWFFSSTHGLERNERKRWTGKIVDGSLRVRIIFVTDRPVDSVEARALANIAKALAPEVDNKIYNAVQPIYIQRPMWREHPNRDPLGDIQIIGRVEQEHDYFTVPADLTTQARWAKAQGLSSDIADHPDAETAVLHIGTDASVRPHLKSAVAHLLIDNLCPEVMSFSDHSMAIVAKLQEMVEQHHDQIVRNLKEHNRTWADVVHYLPDNMLDWSEWCLNHPASLHRKTIKLIKEKQPLIAHEPVSREAIRARVARAIDRFRRGELADPSELACTAHAFMDMPIAELLPAPTGSAKSTLIRAAAVADVTENPGRSAVIMVPRHRLGDEQIEDLQREHPDGNFTAAVWRGRQAWNPKIGDGKQEKICQRADEAKELTDNKLNVDHHLCKQGRGNDRIECPLLPLCDYQGQNLIVANIWFCSHENIVHEMPKVFGDVMRIYIDESPLDAITFGLDTNDHHILALDRLRDPPQSDAMDDELIDARLDLYRMLDGLKFNKDGIAPLTKKALMNFKFINQQIGNVNYNTRRYDPRGLATAEWGGKIVPEIVPTMTVKQVKRELLKAAGNREVAVRAMIWEQIADNEADICGRIQIRHGKDGRYIRVVGLRKIAKGWDSAPTLISDATGNVKLLRAFWPQIMVEPKPWPQLPRPENVRFFQMVDRTLSKYAIAVESKTNNKQELERKADAARRVYGSLLMKAIEYGGRDVGVVIYKSTEEWIKSNCFVPPWIKIMHHGDVTGTNILEEVAALFEIGRNQPPPEALALQAEALFGAYVERREYYVQRKARIPIVPDKGGHSAIQVSLHQFRETVTRALLWQSREGASLQTVGRARAGLRDALNPLDAYRWNDLPLPELGPVEPVLWSEVDAGLDGVMVGSAGVWLHSIPDAVKAFPGLFLTDGLKSARRARSGCFTNKIYLLAEHPHLVFFEYHTHGAGKRPAWGFSLRNAEETKAWLEVKIGPLKAFAVVEAPQPEIGRGKARSAVKGRSRRFGAR
jgi:hypothetical protein